MTIEVMTIEVMTIEVMTIEVMTIEVMTIEVMTTDRNLLKIYGFIDTLLKRNLIHKVSINS